MYAFSLVGGSKFLAEFAAHQSAPQRVLPKHSRIQRPLLWPEKPAQTAGQKNGFDAAQAQADHRCLDGLGGLRQPNKGELATRRHCAAMVLS
jgi:hypothetical protein